MVMKVLTCIRGIVGETDRVICFSASADYRSVFIGLVVEEGPETYSQCPCDFYEWSQ